MEIRFKLLMVFIEVDLSRVMDNSWVPMYHETNGVKLEIPKKKVCELGDGLLSFGGI